MLPTMLLVFLSLAATFAHGYPINDPSSPSNWPLPHNITGDPSSWGALHVHDPSLIKHNGSYWSFTTHDLVGIGKAPTLDGYWEHAGSVLQGESIIPLPGRNDTWAPDVHKVNDTFYLYYSVSTFGSQTSAIGLATSKTLEAGSWTDHGSVLQTGANVSVIPFNITNGIDPNLFVDPKSGQPYLIYGSFFADIWQVPLTRNLSAVSDPAQAVQLSEDPNGTRPEEGSFMSFHNNWYYLWFSHGICCGYNASDLPAPGTEYSIRLGRSRNVSGPFLDRNGTELVEGGGDVVFGSHSYVYGPGGEGVLQDDGRDILYYHYFNRNISVSDDDALLGWNYIEYIEGWPVLKY